jgi:hypothetical protein
LPMVKIDEEKKLLYFEIVTQSSYNISG